MKTSIWAYAFFLLSHSVIGQGLHCELVLHFLNTDIAKKERLMESVSDTIVIWDEQTSALSCPTMLSNDGKVIKIVKSKKSTIPGEARGIADNILILYGFEKIRRKKYLISIWRPYSGAVARIYIWSSKKGYRHTVFETGSF
jgi:hypothetical protein